jgi:hypothetical protein
MIATSPNVSRIVDTRLIAIISEPLTVQCQGQHRFVDDIDRRRREEVVCIPESKIWRKNLKSRVRENLQGQSVFCLKLNWKVREETDIFKTEMFEVISVAGQAILSY